MTASEARWQQYLNKKPDTRREYEFIISQIKNFIKMPKQRSLVVKISDTMITAKMRNDGFKVEELDDNKISISW